MVEGTVEQLPLPGQIWERVDGNHAGYHLLVTKVNAYHVKGRSVGVRSAAPNRGNERQKVSIPIVELHRHYALLRQAKRHGQGHAVMARRSTKPADTRLPTDIKQVQRELAQIRSQGIPPPGTPERGRYLSLMARTKRREPNSLDSIDLLAMRLYVESDVMVQDIEKALSIDTNRLRRAQKILKVPNRQGMHPWRPKVHILDGEELLLVDGEAMFGRDGLMRPVFTEPLAQAASAVAEEETTPAETAPAETTTEEEAPIETMAPETAPFGLTGKGAPRKRTWNGRRSRLTQDEQAEIVRLYGDPTIPSSEILAAYNMGATTLHSVLERHNVPRRAARAGRPLKAQAGHFEEVDGRKTWVRGPAPQAAEQQPLPNDAHAWVEQASRALEADLAKAAKLPSNVTALVVPQVTYSQTTQRAWAVSFTLVQTEVLAAPSLDEAIRVMREKYGEHIDITSVTRNPEA